MISPIKKTKSAIQYTLILIILLAGFFRAFELSNQGFLFHDSVLMHNRAAILKDHLISQSPILQQSEMYVDSKILWLFFIVIGQLLTNNAYWAGHLISAIFGVLTVYLTYKFAKEYYHSERIAILSAFFLSIFSLHIFYSRVAIAESASCFFTLLSIYFYLRHFSRNKSYLLWAGIIGGLAFLCNRYRVLLLPVFVLCFHLNYIFKDTSNNPKKVFPFFFFLLLLCIPPALYESTAFLLGKLNFYIPSLFKALTTSLKFHGVPNIQLYDILTYPYFLFKFSGGIFILLCTLSIFLIRSKKSPLIPLLCCLIQILASSLVDEKGIRSISIILPFLAIIATLSTLFLFRISKRIFNTPLPGTILLTCIFIYQCTFAYNIITFKSGMKKAINWLQENSYNPEILSISPLPLIYNPHGKMLMLVGNWDYTFTNLKKVGGDFFVVSPQAYTYALYSRDHLRNDQLLKFLKEIEQNHIPIATFDNYNPQLQEWALLEHTRHLKTSQRWLHEINDGTSKIRIYDVNQEMQAENK